MRTLFVVLITSLMLASCGSFQRMHYRNLRKVPATVLPVAGQEWREFNTTDSLLKLADAPQPDTEEQSFVVAVEQQQEQQMLIVHSFPEKQHITISESKAKRIIQRVSLPIRRDLSPGVAIFLIFIGFLILGYCVLLLPYLALELGWIVILELILTYSAVNMILRGISILRNRMKPRNNYKED